MGSFWGTLMLMRSPLRVTDEEVPRMEPILFGFAAEREPEVMSLVDGERTFLAAVRSVESLEEGAEGLERKWETCCLSTLLRLVSTGWSGRLVEATGDRTGFVSSCLTASSAAEGRIAGLLREVGSLTMGFDGMLRALRPQLEVEGFADSL